MNKWFVYAEWVKWFYSQWNKFQADRELCCAVGSDSCQPKLNPKMQIESAVNSLRGVLSSTVLAFVRDLVRFEDYRDRVVIEIRPSLAGLKQYNILTIEYGIAGAVIPLVSHMNTRQRVTCIEGSVEIEVGNPGALDKVLLAGGQSYLIGPRPPYRIKYLAGSWISRAFQTQDPSKEI